MKLNEVKTDSHAKVVSLAKEPHFLNRILSVGVTEGAELQVVKNDRKMPVLIYVRETLLALNRKECELIDVEVIG